MEKASLSSSGLLFITVAAAAAAFLMETLFAIEQSGESLFKGKLCCLPQRNNNIQIDLFSIISISSNSITLLVCLVESWTTSLYFRMTESMANDNLIIIIISLN